MNNKLVYPKKYSSLWWIGLWATIWWATSGLYIVAAIWAAIPYYRAENISLGGFWDATFDVVQSNWMLYTSLIIVVTGWVIGGLFWLYALKKANISYKAGLKDLFLTIRR